MAGTVYAHSVANHSQLHRLEFAKSVGMDVLNSVLLHFPVQGVQPQFFSFFLLMQIVSFQVFTKVSFLLEGLLYTPVALISTLMVCSLKDSRITFLLVSPLNGFSNWGCWIMLVAASVLTALTGLLAC